MNLAVGPRLQTATAPERPPFGPVRKLLFCTGAAANGLKTAGLSTFLLVFYNQAVGLPPALVGAAIMVALTIDVLSVPLIGYWSDNLRSSWGRRHPFMYAAAIPFAVSYFLLWSPPTGASQTVLLGYMLACLIVVRLADTFFDLPSTALIPELARGYDERTRLISLSRVFNVVGGLAVTSLAFLVFMKERPDGTGGIVEKSGYLPYAIVSAAVIFTVIVVSSVATRHLVPSLSQAPARRSTPAEALREIAQAMSNRNFVVLCCSGFLNAMAGGVWQSLQLYFGLYFWGLSQAQITLLLLISVAASFVGALLAPVIGARLGKRNAAALMYAAAVVVLAGHIVLRLLDLAPPNGTIALFVMVAVAGGLSVVFAAAMGILLVSMIADVVEEIELKTGRRSEALVLSADQLFKKLVPGVGVFLGGLLLSFADFPPQAQRGAVPPEAVHTLAISFVPIFLVVGLMGVFILLLFRGTRESHQKNLNALQARSAERSATVRESHVGPAREAAAPAAELDTQ